MPQETNLNVSPYFDDYNKEDNYYKVLFKPGYPVQARELNNLQSILQNQIEEFGTHTFKEGSAVIPGDLSYRNDLDYVKLENLFQGFSVERYLPYFDNTRIKGQTSGVTATLQFYISTNLSDVEYTTIYVKYLNSDSTNNSQSTFLDGENILLDEDVRLTEINEGDVGTTLRAGEAIATTLSQDSTGLGSAVFSGSGIYFIRGTFVRTLEDRLLLDYYTSVPTYKVGFRIYEQVVNSYEDSSLNDNSQGFTNFAAPGADRFKIFTTLDKIDIDSTDTSNFVQLLEIREGNLISVENTPEYNVLSQEFARRTFDESGNYYVKSPNITVKETLNNLKGNNGVFSETSLTYNNNTPSDDLATYSISPLKAYVRGYEVENISTTFLDFKKPRETKTLENQSLIYYTGPTFTLNRTYGVPDVGISTSYTISLRDSRVGSDQTSAAGTEIGLARVYDYALESGSYTASNSNVNEWDISLYDVQTYTTITLNEPITLSTPTHVKGKSSGAVGYLRSDVTDSTSLTVYNTKGTFSLGERFIFDGIENTRVSTAVTSFGTSDVKSVYGIVGSGYTFTADTVQSELLRIGQVNITAGSGGISTVTSLDTIFTGNVYPGNVVAFSDPASSDISFAKVETVNISSLTISAVTNVSGICNGALPATDINPSDFRILSTKLQSSTDNTLYTPLPKRNISRIDFSNSNLTIRKQYEVTISSNTTNTISANSGETFLPFDEERYVLVRESGDTEELTSDKFEFIAGSTALRINGLSSDGPAKLIATLRKTNIKSKVKNKNTVNTIVVDKSKFAASGIGASTLNDGLTYGNYAYGTRVQDEDICLLYPDVTKLYGVFESTGTSDPTLPSLTLTSLSGPTNKTNDLLLGEEFIGSTSQAVGLYVEKVNDLKISINKLNENIFVDGEVITFKESGITAVISAVGSGDKNITSNFTFEDGQRDTIYDQSRIVRKQRVKEPTRKLKIVFERASFLPSDDGDLTTINSYDQFDYCDVNSSGQLRNSDILDIRPRVSTPDVSEGARSPFEFLSRSFTSAGNSASNVLASDEDILLSYSFYLPRVDKISLTKDGIFQLSEGVPSEKPQPPIIGDDSLELATVSLPAYLCNVNEASINLRQYKRYRMSDIAKLENRIKNLEFYTALSLLETDTSNLLITDSNGLSRFKSGFFVDDFSTTTSQKKVTGVKNSIDIKNSELRPSHYTTSIDLLLGTNSAIGIGTDANPSADLRTDNGLIGSGMRRTGQLVTLDYEEVAEITQPFSSVVVNVNPYTSGNFKGTVELFPCSDVWVDQIRLDPVTLNAEGNFVEVQAQLEADGFDTQSGFGPVTWDSWETVWTGEEIEESTREVTRDRAVYEEKLETTIKTGTSTRDGVREVFKEQFDTTSFGDQILKSEVIPFIRSRNLEFTTKRLKPETRFYNFLDGVDVNNFAVPKLLEIEMTSGVFEVGETIIGTGTAPLGTTNRPEIRFRVAQQNHKYGSYDSPSDVYTINPYTQEQTISDSYSSTSSLLNVDTYSLSNQPQGNYYGYVQTGMILRGQTSGAEARITNLRLVSDNVGTLIGSLFIPNPNIDVNPKFVAGTKLFRLTTSPSNSQIVGSVASCAEEKFQCEGRTNTVQENIIVVRNGRIESESMTESQVASESGDPVVVETTKLRDIVTRTSSGGGGGGSSRTYTGQRNDGSTPIYSPGSSTAIGLAEINRAIADGYSESSIRSWVGSVETAGPLAQQWAASDIELKENIKPIDNALNRLLSINF